MWSILAYRSHKAKVGSSRRSERSKRTIGAKRKKERESEHEAGRKIKSEKERQKPFIVLSSTTRYRGTRNTIEKYVALVFVRRFITPFCRGREREIIYRDKILSIHEFVEITSCLII